MEGHDFLEGQNGRFCSVMVSRCIRSNVLVVDCVIQRKPCFIPSRKVGQESSVVTLIEKPLTTLSSSFKIMFIKLLLNFNHFIRMPTKVFFVTRQNEDVEIPRPFFVALKRSLLTSNAYWIAWIFSVILSVSFLPDLPLLKFKDVPFNWHFATFVVWLYTRWVTFMKRHPKSCLNKAWTRLFLS